jgi:drug/metabolite transporter (DMT)-like permease
MGHFNMGQMAILFALGSAALFGLSTPAAKILLGSVHPAMLAGLLYCGAGLGVGALRLLRKKTRTPDVALVRRDLPWLVAAICIGGIVGPLLLLIGLAQTQAATASLLLSFEAAATALIARLVFKESYGPRLILGMAFLVAGAATLAWSGVPTLETMTGPLAIIGACFAWALDNNLTRKISSADPMLLVEIRGLVAGPVNLALGFWVGGAFPTLAMSLIGAAVGFVSYGVSLVLFVLALRGLGAARTGAYFATAPFMGALASVVVLGDPVTMQLLGAGALMAVGVWLHITERHAHAHSHGGLQHAHRHVHDPHHQHEHQPSDEAGEPHDHVHDHASLTHAHPHMPDPHHRHGHA